MNLPTIMLWQGLIGQAASLGVTSWSAIRGLLQDAGADDAAIAALQPKWDALLADVRRAAGQ